MRWVLAVFAFTPAAWAQCDDQQHLFLACSFANGKSVQVCTDGSTVDYTFGRPGQPPELTLNLVYHEGAEYVEWPGVGSTIWEAIRLTNGDITYEVYGGFERLPANGESDEVQVSPFFGGISVTDLAGLELAHLSCVPETVNFGY